MCVFLSVCPSAALCVCPLPRSVSPSVSFTGIYTVNSQANRRLAVQPDRWLINRSIKVRLDYIEGVKKEKKVSTNQALSM